MEDKDYKKLYEDVVALAKDGLTDGLYLSSSAKAVTEFLFPQLKETEDEKAKRELTTFLINFNNGTYSRPSASKIDSWIKWIDKKCEQKPTNEVKPKFDVGDWIVYEGLGTYKVVEIHGGWYSVIDSNDRRWSVMFERESLCHIWTIQDAKDGDILTVVNDERPFIFKGLLDKFHPKNPVSYCGLDKLYGFIISNSNDLWTDEEVEPATKKISDSLFQRIHEEGYEWDIENKKLIEIEKQVENFDEAEKEKNDFVSGQFIECRKSFNEFKELESYWLEYVGDDTYIGRSDNILNQRFHITPQQLFTLFTHQQDNKKQGEQNHNEKDEPKFKAGDWIVQENIGVYKIIEICESWYEVIDFKDNHYSISFDNENMCHLWTIQDAKDGDVLYSLDSKQPFLYKEKPQFSQARGYCCINKFGEFALWNTSKCIICTDECIPANKEQRDILFSKMKEEGYEWDSENKELIYLGMFSLTDIDEIFEKISETIVPNKNNWTEEDGK